MFYTDHHQQFLTSISIYVGKVGWRGWQCVKKKAYKKRKRRNTNARREKQVLTNKTRLLYYIVWLKRATLVLEIGSFQV